MSGKNPPKSASPISDVLAQAMKAPPPVFVAENGVAAIAPQQAAPAEEPASAQDEAAVSVRREAYPWKNAPRSKQHLVQLRPSNELFLKLDWLWMHSADEYGNRPSKHQILIDIIERGIDSKIAKLIKDGK